MTLDLGLVALCLTAGWAQAQSAVAPLAGTRLSTYPDLQLSAYYEPDLQQEKPDDAGEFSYRTRFALHPDSDPLHKGADPCSPLRLALGMGPDQPKDPKHPGKPGEQVPLLPTGGITLNEIKPECVAKDSPGRSQEDILGDFVENIRHIDGIPPLSRTITYKVQDKTVLMAAAGGFSKDTRGRRVASAGSTYLASIAAISNGHLLLWSVTANDVALFNRLLTMHVCFDAPSCKAGYDRLVPFELKAGGDPATAVPR